MYRRSDVLAQTHPDPRRKKRGDSDKRGKKNFPGNDASLGEARRQCPVSLGQQQEKRKRGGLREGRELFLCHTGLKKKTISDTSEDWK